MPETTVQTVEGAISYNKRLSRLDIESEDGDEDSDEIDHSKDNA